MREVLPILQPFAEDTAPLSLNNFRLTIPSQYNRNDRLDASHDCSDPMLLVLLTYFYDFIIPIVSKENTHFLVPYKPFIDALFPLTSVNFRVIKVICLYFPAAFYRLKHYNTHFGGKTILSKVVCRFLRWLTSNEDNFMIKLGHSLRCLWIIIGPFSVQC